MKSLWSTTEPPHDGTAIVAIGRIIASDEFSTWSEPFVSALVWEKDRSDYEGWHYSSDHMTVARTLGDEVIIDYWAPFPKEDVISRKRERLQIDQPIGGSPVHEGECAKSYGGHPCTCEKELPVGVVRCQFCLEPSKATDWKKDVCPKCGKKYDVILAIDSETE